jgi:hypothetical protein
MSPALCLFSGWNGHVLASPLKLLHMSMFWISVLIGILSNLATGVLLAIVFETMQRRRDLQRQLGELWLRATRASEAVNNSRLRKDGGAEAYALWLALQDEWLRARHSLNFALTEDKRRQVEETISAIYALHILNCEKANRKFLKLYPVVRKQDAQVDAVDDSGAAPVEPEENTDYVNFGEWAMENGQPEAKAEFDEFQKQRAKLSGMIDNMLNFNPFDRPHADADDSSQSLPDELAQSWHFGYLFSRVWKWFFYEIYYSLKRAFRKKRSISR